MSYHTIYTQKHSWTRIVIALLAVTPLTSQAAIILDLNSNANTKQCSSQTLELSSDGQLRVKGLDCFSQLNPSPNISKNLILSGNNGNSVECLFKGLTLNANGSLSIDTNDSCLEPEQTKPPSNSQQLGTVKQVSHQATVLPNTQAFNPNNSIILTGVPSSKGGQPGAIQLTDDGQGDIKAQFTEWAYLDGKHLEEQFDYAILNKGCYLNDDQTGFIVSSFDQKITAGSNLKDGNWKDVFPHHDFPNNCSISQDKPITSVVMTIQPDQEQGKPVVVRAKDLSSDKFQAALFEDKAITEQNSQDRTESFTIGYIAFYGNPNPGNIQVNGTKIPFSIQTLKVNHNWTKVPGFSPVQEIRLQEDENPDFGITETWHKAETVKVLNIDNKLFAQDISFNGKQPFVFRRR